MNTSAVRKYRILFTLLVMTLFIFSMSDNFISNALAQDIPTEKSIPELAMTEKDNIEEVNPYFSIEHTTLPDGTPISGYMIKGPPAPLPEYEVERAASIMPIINATVLPNFPSYSWVFGCSAVSGAMISSYYDRGTYTNMYAGPTNGGVMPVTDTSWPTWNDGYITYPNNPLVASHIGIDGRATKGSIDDYWVKYESTANDPYITGGWNQHAWETAIGDYMKTSQSVYDNTDGSTQFFNYTSSSNKFTCSIMESTGYDDVDGTYGRKLFYEARGYTVTDCYNQKTDNTISGGFSLANFQAEINAGHPVLLNLAGHSIVGYGYNASTIYIRDTWDSNPSNNFTMPWGGSYEGMELRSVSVVHLKSSSTDSKLLLSLLIRSSGPNLGPTNILLSNNTIAEDEPLYTVVGTLSTVDPNVGDTFTYSLVSGSGDTGNGSFNVSGNQLRSSVVFDYESQNSYSIRIRTTDQGSLHFEKVFTILITPSGGIAIPNGDFELGPVSWEEYSSNGWDLIVQSFPGGVSPYNGTWAVWLGGDYLETAYVQQPLLVPSSHPYLSYYHWIASGDACGYDYGRVRVNGSLVDQYNLCSSTDTGGWVRKVINLSAYAGTMVTIRIEAYCDDSLNSNLFIDHVEFSSSLFSIEQISSDFIDIDAILLKQDVIKK